MKTSDIKRIERQVDFNFDIQCSEFKDCTRLTKKQKMPFNVLVFCILQYHRLAYKDLSEMYNKSIATISQSNAIALRLNERNDKDRVVLEKIKKIKEKLQK